MILFRPSNKGKNMTKKTLLAVITACFAVPATMAAQVELYGRVDTGLSYTKQKVGWTVLESTDPSGEIDEFSLDSGNSTSSRWGLRASEELGNGLKIGFVLENGFGSDTGALDTNSTLFNRESTLWIDGNFGRVYAGRMTTLMSDTGSVGFFGGLVSPFGTGWGKLAGHAAVMASYDTSRYDNAVAYVSPTIGGVTIYAQYAMGTNDRENESSSDRYAALGASYINGSIQLAAVVDYLNKQSAGPVLDGVDDMLNLRNEMGKPDDAWTISLGGAYDFEAVKVYGAVQYFKNAADIGDIMEDFGLILIREAGGTLDDRIAHSYFGADGVGLNIGADIPLAGGVVKISAGYMNGKTNNIAETTIDADIKNYNIMAGYEYPFSKRTNIYAGAGLTKLKLESNVSDDFFKYENKIFQAMLGLVHKF